MEPCVSCFHLTYCMESSFIMNRYISKSFTTTKNTIDQQYTERRPMWCQLLLVSCRGRISSVGRALDGRAGGRGFDSQGWINTVTRFCACAASWFLVWRTFFQDLLFVKKSSSIDPEMPEKAIISVFESYLVHFGSFKRRILYFCASFVEKIRSHSGEVREGILFCCQCSCKRIKCGV